MHVPFIKPDIRTTDIHRMNTSIKTGWINPGPYTQQLEKQMTDYVRAPYAVFVNCCTSALHLGLIALGVGPGDEVITTPLTWVTTASPILHLGAKVVFADVDSGTGLIDIVDVQRKITKKTKVIIPVHLYGQMADMKQLSTLAKRHNISILEDAAHVLEGRRDGVRPGGLSAMAALSFAPAKNLTSGQGGAIITTSKEYAKRIQILRRGGVVNRDGRRWMLALGYNYLSTDFQAALLSSQFERIDNIHRARQKSFTFYCKSLAHIEEIRCPTLLPSVEHTGHLFVVWVDPAQRDLIRAYMEKRGVETSIHYPVMHLEPYYREQFGYKEGDFPVAEELAASTIALPIYNRITRKEQEYVVNMLIEAVGATRGKRK